MDTNFETPLQSDLDGADPSIHIQDMVYPEVDNNLEEGDEYLDDKNRVKEQPYKVEINENN